MSVDILGRSNVETGMPNPILEATSFEKGIDIILEKECRRGMDSLVETAKAEFLDPESVIIVPILYGGGIVGQELAKRTGFESTTMQMSYYNDRNERLPAPKCLSLPDPNIIMGKGGERNIVLAEAVVETRATTIAAEDNIRNQINTLNKSRKAPFAYPIFYQYTLISKMGDEVVMVPNLRSAFNIHNNVWVWGWGCDYGGRGREVLSIKGSLSPFATTDDLPTPPYYSRSLLFK
jgi:hypoxanthine-guanine phosphoribosyltransferase